MGWRLESRYTWLATRGVQPFTVDVKAWRVRVFIPAGQSWFYEQGDVRVSGGVDDVLGGLFDDQARPVLVFQTLHFEPNGAVAALGGYIRQDFKIEGEWD